MSIMRSPNRIVVASYNLHGCVGNDGRRDVARVARIIERLDADVIALQEVESMPASRRELQTDILSHLVGLTAISAPTMERADSAYGNAILTRLPIRAVRKVDISYRRREPRGVIDADLDAEGTPLRVMATHLGLWPSERRYQVQRILEIASDRGEGLTVLLGDMNEWFVSGRPLRWLHRRFGTSRGRRTFPARIPLFALDRIWVHPVTALASFDVIDNAETRAASDHLPVRAEIVR